MHEGKKTVSITPKKMSITDSDFELMKEIMVSPDEFEPGDFRAYEVRLANNIIDRDKERFVKDVLNSFANTLTGKGKLNGHSWGLPGDGRFFKSSLEKMSFEK